MAEIPERPPGPLTVAISECLLGSPVRFDAGHKRSALPHNELQGLFTFVGLCPEVAIGLGTPREPVRLVGDPDQPQAIEVRSRVNHTAALQAEVHRVAPTLDQVAGYIFMKNSPSCGLFRVKVYADSGIPVAAGRGIYAAGIAQAWPDLPLEECGRLQDPVLRENFVMRTFVYAHWQELLRGGLEAARLIEFHSRYKYLLMAHSVAHFRTAGRLISDLSGDLAALAGQYFRQLMAGLSCPATRGGHANVLAHLQGHVKRSLPAADRQELAASIEAYRLGSLPLMAPLTLLRHHLGHHAGEHVLRQIYLDPHPGAAGLRRSL